MRLLLLENISLDIVFEKKSIRSDNRSYCFWEWKFCKM